MFQNKKIQAYFNDKSVQHRTSFDELLEEYVFGEMKKKLVNLGAKKIKFHMDWHQDYKCINMSCIYHQKYLDLQIEATEFSIGYDPVEPDEHIYYPLENKDQVYQMVKQLIETPPDVEVRFEFYTSRKTPAISGYRPDHLVMDDYLTTGIHQYFDVNQVAPGETVYGTITFITPEYYPHCLYDGKIIPFFEGKRIVGTATVQKILNPLLDVKPKK